MSDIKAVPEGVRLVVPKSRVINEGHLALKEVWTKMEEEVKKNHPGRVVRDVQFRNKGDDIEVTFYLAVVE